MTTTTERLEQERAAFEAWIQSCDGHPFAGAFANLMWKTWQARAALVQPAEPVAVKPWQERMNEHYSEANVRCYAASHFMGAELADWRALADQQGSDAKWQRLLKAATTYANNWCQDEAEPEDDPEDLVCTPEQHAEAVELFAAIAATQPQEGA